MDITEINDIQSLKNIVIELRQKEKQLQEEINELEKEKINLLQEKIKIDNIKNVGKIQSTLKVFSALFKR